MLHIETYPLPTPATYPKGAGTPKKCFLFRVFSETEGTAIFTCRLFMNWAEYGEKSNLLRSMHDNLPRG